ncbi:glucose-6-phosphate isomerase [Marinicella rhabdoformis]|uniref:glucose-6-phosphate isomerase n=1 Tax=Marinicella rhabdoformis TaxID=2580566 RepID=UPI0015CFEBE3|nr:glucose-6-phosphate isomerase [Marinicella rhabdoformis]
MRNNRVWATLEQLAQKPEHKDLKHSIADVERMEALTLQCGDLYLDCSKNWLSLQVFEQLQQLAEASDLKASIQKLFNLETVNTSENQAAGHTTLRDPNHQNRKHNLERMKVLAERIKNNKITTAFGKPVKQLVNIGIGGSYLGPRLAIEALTDLQSESQIPVYFAASVDDSLINQLFQSIDIEHSLFCISSKSFGTAETLMNAEAVIEKLKQRPGYLPNDNQSSLMAITAKPERAKAIGINDSMILPFDTTIGGRFSLWSSIGFPIMLAAGSDAFEEMLDGANIMDNHYLETPFDKNMPVVLALIGIWYRNFIGLSGYACLPYDARLRCFPKWLQQLMMESTGKMHNLQGQTIDYPTSPWVFGDHGQLSQHAFFQAFHQGIDALPMDFIGVLDHDSPSQRFLLFNMIAQGAALMSGESHEHIDNHDCPGNKPSTTLLLNSMNPKAVGQLLAMYEHMIYTQSVIWNINCFDQPGVELGKKLAKRIEKHVQENHLDDLPLDPSTQNLIKKVMNHEG